MCLLLIGLGVSAASGARDSALTGYPDEASHYVTGLMVHEYLTGGDWRHPVAFAEDYYLRYPKVALGHWPPLFYVVLAGWMWMAGTSVPAALMLQTALAALTGTVLFAVLRPRSGVAMGGLAAVCYMLLPASQSSYTQVMAEPLLALLTLAAGISVSRYVESGCWKSPAWYALFCALAIFTKGSGLALLGLPAAAAVLSGRISLLRDWRMHAAVAAAALATAPWFLLTLGMARNGMELYRPIWQTTAGQSVEAVQQFVPLLGPAMAVLALAGAALAPAGWRRESGEQNSFAASMLGVVLLTYAMHIISPSGMEPRRLMMALPALLALAALAGGRLESRLGGVWRPGARWAVPAVAATVFLATFGGIGQKPGRLWREFFSTELRPMLAPGTAVLLAGEMAENVVISEAAQREPRPTMYFVRASKLLTDSDWLGADYRLLFSSREEVARELSEVPINLVVLENGAVEGCGSGGKPDAHVALVRQVVREPGGPWERVAARPVDAGLNCSASVEVYRRQPPVKKEIKLRLSLRRMLGRDLETK